MNVIRNLKEELNKAQRIVLIILFVFLLTGAIGMLAHGICISIGGPIWVRNQYIGLWLTSMILFYSAQGIYLILKPRDDNLFKMTFFVEIACLTTCLLFSFINIICYGLAKKADAIIWCLIMLVIFLISIYGLINKRKHASNLTGLNSEKFKENNKKTKLIKVLQIFNVIFRLIFLIFLIFLTIGSILIGGLTVTYPPRGKFSTIDLGDGSGRKITIHHLCDGPINSLKPTFLFQGSGSHGLMDFYGLQTLLKENNRRSCIWDLAGLGYSDYMYLNSYDPVLYYNNLFKSFNETTPFIFVASGGGGRPVYQYALEHPEMISSITFLDVFPENVEWLTPKVLKNWTDDEYNAYKKLDLEGRYSLFRLINGLGVPWGLMPLFVPTESVYPENTKNEVRWYFLADKTWTTQEYILRWESDNNFTSPYNYALNSSITVNNIMSVKSDQQVISQTCGPMKYPVNSSECDYEIKSNKLSIEWRLNLTRFNNIINCTMNECNQGYFFIEGSNYTVQNLLKLY